MMTRLIFRRLSATLTAAALVFLAGCQGTALQAVGGNASALSAEATDRALVGRVVDAEGKPKAGVVVTAWLNNTAARRILAKGPSATTGSDGQFVCRLIK
ncbi:MAG: hypothetical protein VKP57_09420 [Candidatus Sericytochromatia bacterium]|nr:hypothetical protein [Candidatus Sericytochromatia bacterium]